MSQTFTDDCYASAHTGTTDLQAFEDNFAALKSAFSGTSAPPNAVAGMWWYDTSANILKLRNEANDAWQSVWDFANNKPVVTNNISADFGAAMKDAAASTASLRTLGTGSQQACAGNDSRLGIVDGSVTGAKLALLTAGTANIFYAPGSTSATNYTVYTKIYQYKIARSGVVTVHFHLYNSGDGKTIYGRIYVNGVAVGTERSRASTGTSSFAEDITIVDTDLIQLYVKASGSGDMMSSVEEFTITCTDPLQGVAGF